MSLWVPDATYHARSTDAATATAERCPVCEATYESVSVDETGLIVNLLENDRYRRVRFEPVAGPNPWVRFYHQTHERAALTE